MDKLHTSLTLTENQKSEYREFCDKRKDLYTELHSIFKNSSYIESTRSMDFMEIKWREKKIIRRYRDQYYSNIIYGYDLLLSESTVLVLCADIKYIYVDAQLLEIIRLIYVNKDYDLDCWDSISDPALTKDNNKCPLHKLPGIKVNIEKPDSVINLFTKENPYSGIETIEIPMRDTEKMTYLSLYKKYPFIELLVKAGYFPIVSDWISEIEADHNDSKFKILLKSGKDLKSIIQLPKFIYEDLKNEGDINKWNNIRLLNKKYGFTNESYQKFKDFDLPYHPNSTLQKILNMEFNGKKLYTLNSLMTYLSRVDMYQAIEPEEASRILLDYLTMNIEMGVMPDVNSNSLKREHDVTVRNYNLVAKEIEEEKFKKVAKKLKFYEYEGDKYCIIAPTSGQDLINEGRNNRNCVGSYIRNILNGRDMIFFMREKAHPEKSMITIELSPNGKEIWQKYETANRYITDPKKLEFIDEWMTEISKRQKSKTA